MKRQNGRPIPEPVDWTPDAEFNADQIREACNSFFRRNGMSIDRMGGSLNLRKRKSGKGAK